jgi:pantoate--beta-alanine ligase
MRQVLNDAGINRIDYIAIADPGTLIDMQPVKQDAVLLVAARLGSTRLIDNCVWEPGAE